MGWYWCWLYHMGTCPPLAWPWAEGVRERLLGRDMVTVMSASPPLLLTLEEADEVARCFLAWPAAPASFLAAPDPPARPSRTPPPRTPTLPLE